MLNRFAFVGASRGRWRVTNNAPVAGDGLPPVTSIDVRQTEGASTNTTAIWTLHGQISNLRYAARSEVTALRAVQEPLGRTQARCGAMIPIRKTQAWWDLAQDERRAIFEETSQHTAIGMRYLPAIARQLFHARDLGEPFDFVTWFEFAPEHASAFDELLARLRATREWTYVEREVDIRIERAA